MKICYKSLFPFFAPMKFEKEIEVRWADVDQNRHVRHSAYYDYGAHTRVAYLLSVGYDAERFGKENFGPILFHEECTFLKEIKANDRVRINMRIGEMRPDGSRWTIHHELFNGDGDKLAHLSVKGAWMDLKERKLIPAPEALKTGFENLEKGEGFVYGK